MQSIAGTFLYIARAVDPTMLVDINDIGDEQALPTTDTIQKTKMLMDYAATQTDAVIRFHVNDMCLHIDSDDAYLVQPKTCRRAAGHFYISDNPPLDNIRPAPSPNGSILTKCQTIRTVMASSAEAETGAVLLNGQQAVPIRTALTEMGHPQPPTPIKTDRATSYGIITGNMRRKHSKAFDMRFHLMHCRIKKNKFHLYWQREPKTLLITSPSTSLPNTTYG